MYYLILYSWFFWRSCMWSVLWPTCVDRTVLSWPAFCSGYSDTRTWRPSCSESSMTVRSALKVLLLFLLCCIAEFVRIIHRVACFSRWSYDSFPRHHSGQYSDGAVHEGHSHSFRPSRPQRHHTEDHGEQAVLWSNGTKQNDHVQRTNMSLC